MTEAATYGIMRLQRPQLQAACIETLAAALMHREVDIQCR